MRVFSPAPFLAIGAVFLAGASFSVSCGDSGGDPNSTKTYDKHGITFEYPGNWKTGKLEVKSEPSGNELWSSEGLVLTNDDVISVQGYKLNVKITPEVFKANTKDLIDDVLSVTEGHKTLSDPTTTQVGGLPAITYDIAATSTGGKAVQSKLYFIFKDDTEYFFNCQAAPANQEKVDAACERVTGSFKVK